MAHLYGKFVWFEHVSADPARARQFYEGLLGWKVGDDADYPEIGNAGTFIGGMVRAEDGAPDHWRSWVSVPDVDERYRAALAAGGTAAMPPRDFPVGRGATVVDPTGARISLWKDASGDRADPANTAAGDWDWVELATPDPQRALAFYESVFGYTHADWDMGPQGIYHVLNDAQGRSRAGVTKAPAQHPGALWIPYVKVEDADAIAARVAPLGGTLAQAPAEVPGVGRAGMLLDPLGAAMGFIQPAVKA